MLKRHSTRVLILSEYPVVRAGLRSMLRRAAPACRPRPPLSTREQQVLGLLSRGHTNREIAGSLRVSVKTVETYKARLRDKLGLLRRADFVQYGLETGLLAPAAPAAEE